MLVLINADRIPRLLPRKAAALLKLETFYILTGLRNFFFFKFLSLGVDKRHCSIPELLLGGSLESRGGPEIGVMCEVGGLLLTHFPLFPGIRMLSFSWNFTCQCILVDNSGEQRAAHWQAI